MVADNFSRKQYVLELLSEVWSQGNLDRIEFLIASEYTIFHDPGDPWNGRVLTVQQYVDRVAKSRAPFPDQRFTVVDLLEDGEKVAVTWHWVGTHLAEIAGFAPSGRKLAMSGATVYSFNGERICGHWQISDRLSIFQQLHGGSA
ncbi:MAG: ester cyclase [Rhodanobacteraceae bacterium]|nr:ester cyclase [Rhodanobacteraceae bacterium]